MYIYCRVFFFFVKGQINTIYPPNQVGALGKLLWDEIQPIQVFCSSNEKTPG